MFAYPSRKLLGENAAALYRFDLAALRAEAAEIGITPELVREPLLEIPKDSTRLAFQRARGEEMMARSGARA